MPDNRNNDKKSSMMLSVVAVLAGPTPIDSKQLYKKHKGCFRLVITALNFVFLLAGTLGSLSVIAQQ